MIDHDRCPDCNNFWQRCPCCSESFCTDCGMLESEAVFEEEEEWEQDKLDQGDFV